MDIAAETYEGNEEQQAAHCSLFSLGRKDVIVVSVVLSYVAVIDIVS